MQSHDHARQTTMAGFITLLGNDVARFEVTVYNLASRMTVDDAEAELARYQGGSWELVASETEAGMAFWWRLDSDVPHRFLNNANGSEETVDAELLSLVVNLMALSHLCIFHYQHCHYALNEAYANLHEALKLFCYAHLQGDQKRLAQFAAMID